MSDNEMEADVSFLPGPGRYPAAVTQNRNNVCNRCSLKEIFIHILLA